MTREWVHVGDEITAAFQEFCHLIRLLGSKAVFMPVIHTMKLPLRPIVAFGKGQAHIERYDRRLH